LIRDELEERTESEIQVEKGTGVDSFLEEQGIEREEVLVSRNGTIISGKHKLEDGDELKVMDVIAGG
jgi:thiamine biosynthesis protein ThiS